MIRNSIVRSFIVGLFFCAGLSMASEMERKSSSAAEASSSETYHKDLVRLFIKEGLPVDVEHSLKDGAWVWKLANGQTGIFPENFPVLSTKCDPIPTTELAEMNAGEFIEYMAKHSDAQGIELFCRTPRTIGGSSSINRAIGHAFKIHNPNLLQTLLNSLSSMKIMDYSNVITISPCSLLPNASATFKQCPELMEVLVEHIKKQYPDDWQVQLSAHLDYPASTSTPIKPELMLPGFNYLLDSCGATPAKHPVLHTFVRYAAYRDLHDNPFLPFIKLLTDHPDIDLELFDTPAQWQRERGVIPQKAIAYLPIQGKHKDTIREIRKLLLNPQHMLAELLNYVPVKGVCKIIAHYVLVDDQELLDAAEEGNKSRTRHLLEAGAQPNSMNPGKKTSLMYCAEKGDTDTVQDLIAAGADVTLADNHGFSSLMLSAEAGHEDVIEEILGALIAKNKLSEINRKSTYTAPAPSRMVRRVVGEAPRRRYVRRDIAGGESGAQVQEFVDVTDDKAGQTALILATKRGHDDVVQQLLRAKADASIKDSTGKTALDYAKEHKHEALIKLLTT